MTLTDTEVITLVMENLFARFLLIPECEEPLIEELLAPLLSSRQYITTVYPESPEEKSLDSFNEKFEKIEDKALGESFFDCFVERCPRVIELILENVVAQGDIKNQLGQIALCLVIAKFDQDNCSISSWILNNLFSKDSVDHFHYTGNTTINSFMLNTRIAQLFSKSISSGTIKKLSDKATERLHECNSEDFVEIVKTVGVRKEVFQRLLASFDDGECVDGEPCAAAEEELFIGGDWTRDITLDALLWRIQMNDHFCKHAFYNLV